MHPLVILVVLVLCLHWKAGEDVAMMTNLVVTGLYTILQISNTTGRHDFPFIMDLYFTCVSSGLSSDHETTRKVVICFFFNRVFNDLRSCPLRLYQHPIHYSDVIMTTIASLITSLAVVYSAVYSDADQRKHQSSASLAFVWGIHRDRWIPRTKGQLRGKCFHLMTSSWGRDAGCMYTLYMFGIKTGSNLTNWICIIGTGLHETCAICFNAMHA